MALNIKNLKVEALASEVARMTGETKTEAILRALAERKARLDQRIDTVDRRERALRFLEREVWPSIPPDEQGRRLTREQHDAILGYGPDGL
ncbi:MAG: type II toxin-antitoxin system VapB family antitoxin [Actinomycetota bacterium]